MARVERELPFSTSEYRARLSKVRQEMDQKGMDLLMVVWPENIYYLTGYDTPSYFWFQVLLVPSKDDPVMVVRRSWRKNVLDLTWLDQCEGYEDTENPLDVMARVLADRGWVRQHIGMELDGFFLTVRQFLGLRHRLGNFDPLDASQLINRIRLIKSEQELTYIRQAARAADASAEAAVQAIRPGARECEVAAEMHSALYLAGSDYLGHPPLLSSGPRSALSFAVWTERVIQTNDPIFLEPGGCVRRYHAAFVRMAHVGPPQDKVFLRLVDLGLEGVNDALARIRPGITCAEVDDILKAPARKAGFGHFATTRGGYSIGIAFPPDWSEGRTLEIKQDDPSVLQANMTLHVVSSLWYEEKSLIGFGQTARVTETGCEVLTHFPPKLILR